jgi:hypothetical protein
MNDAVSIREDDCLIDAREVDRLTGGKPPAGGKAPNRPHKLVTRHGFPKPVKIGRASRWLRSEVLAWISAQAANSRAAQEDVATCKIRESRPQSSLAAA